MSDFYKNLTWKCEVCGRIRHDKYISVYKNIDERY